LEHEFDQFFKGIGFKRVTDIIDGTPKFENADYIHNRHRTVVELKIIDKDFFGQGGLIHRLKTIVTVPKVIDENGFGQYEFVLPEMNREGQHDTIEEPLRRIIKKANRQIKETKKYLLNDDGVGFLMLALNMRTSIDPEAFRKLTGELLAREFSSIDGFIVCTPSWGAYNRETKKEHPLCLPTTPIGGPEIIRQMCVQLGQEWVNFGNLDGHA
jgi:hypothetical protein